MIRIAERAARSAVLCAAVVSTPAVLPAQNGAVSGGNATILVGTYTKGILVLDERNMAVVDTMKVSIGTPVQMVLSSDRTRLYTTDPYFETVEVFDLATRKAVDKFTLTEGNKRVRISGLNVDPKHRFAVFLIKTFTKKIDRFEIGAPKLVKYDLAQHKVTDTIPWPRDEERENARILFSPSGENLYFFTNDDILIYNANTLKQVDRWDYAQPLEQGMGRFNFGFPADVYEEPGFYTGLFRITDPVQNRQLMGVARVNLEQRTVDFYTLGPSGPTGLALSPDRKRGWGIRQEIGLYEFWTFDLEQRRVVGRTEFKGRPRMGLTPSSNGRILYIHTAGPTIDLYDSQTFRLLRTVDLGADMTRFMVVPSTPAAGRR
ncbi:MAG: YncE family protein [Longimicrobiales bacterium]